MLTSREREVLPPEARGLVQEMRLSLAAKLGNLISKEKEELEGQWDGILVDNRKTLLTHYKESEFFRRVYRKAISFFCLPRSPQELKDFRQRFAGRIFQDLAQIFIRAKLPGPSVLLSPERTLRFYEQLYPRAQRIGSSLGLDSLGGISVPDGLIVEERDGKTQIVAICEYTLWGNQQNLKRRENRVNIEKKCFSKLFAEDAYLLFVVPEKADLLRLKNLGRSTQFQKMPFIHGQVRDFIDSIYEFYQPGEDSATLVEIQRRAREQWERGEEYRRGNRPLTPEYSQYLARSKVKVPKVHLEGGLDRTPRDAQAP